MKVERFSAALALVALSGCATYSNPTSGPTANVRIGYPDLDVRSFSRALVSSGPSCSKPLAVRARAFKGREWDARDAQKLAAYKEEVFSLHMPRDDKHSVSGWEWAEIKVPANEPVRVSFEYDRKNGGGQSYIYCYPAVTMKFEQDRNYEVSLLVVPTEKGEMCMVFANDLDTAAAGEGAAVV